MIQKKKVVVFGGAGFLGSHLCKQLSKAGYRVIIFDCKDIHYVYSDIEIKIGNILDRDLVDSVVKGADIVFNLSGISDIEEANLHPIETVSYNILGHVHIIEACRRYQVKRLVYASSVYVYSREGGFYRCSKQAAELYTESYHESYGLEYTILRYGSLYGSGADLRNGIYKFIYNAVKKGSIVYEGSPDAFREYINVEDAARLSVEILAEKYKNTSIVLTGIEKLSISQLFKMIEEILGKKIKIVYQNQEANNPHYQMTPYSYLPKPGMKLTSSYHVDIGQGILKVVEEITNQLKNVD